jgi:predicted dehydrogenase
VPRLGFLGVGWIGRHRMAAMAAAAPVEVVVLADASTPRCRRRTR